MICSTFLTLLLGVWVLQGGGTSRPALDPGGIETGDEHGSIELFEALEVDICLPIFHLSPFIRATNAQAISS